jgi:hypothetical protein
MQKYIMQFPPTSSIVFLPPSKYSQHSVTLSLPLISETMFYAHAQLKAK